VHLDPTFVRELFYAQNILKPKLFVVTRGNYSQLKTITFTSHNTSRYSYTMQLEPAYSHSMTGWSFYLRRVWKLY